MPFVHEVQKLLFKKCENYSLKNIIKKNVFNGYKIKNIFDIIV